MIILLSTITLIFAGISCIQLELHKTVFNALYKTRELYKYVSIYNKSDNNQSVARKLHTSLGIICTVIAVYIRQYLNKNIKKLDNKTFEISYVIHGHLYKMVVIPKRGPNEYVLITDDNGIDISDIIVPYMGPRYDFHRHPFTPKFFKFKALTFHSVNGDEKRFEEDEILLL